MVKSDLYRQRVLQHQQQRQQLQLDQLDKSAYYNIYAQNYGAHDLTTQINPKYSNPLCKDIFSDAEVASVTSLDSGYRSSSSIASSLHVQTNKSTADKPAQPKQTREDKAGKVNQRIPTESAKNDNEVISDDNSEDNDEQFHWCASGENNGQGDRDSEENGTGEPAQRQRKPKCAKCFYHGVTVEVKGHKRKCPFRNCECKLCQLTVERREVSAKQIAVRRRLEEDPEDRTWIATMPTKCKRARRGQQDNNEKDGESGYGTDDKSDLSSAVKALSLTTYKQEQVDLLKEITERFKNVKIKNNLDELRQVRLDLLLKLGPVRSLGETYVKDVTTLSDEISKAETEMKIQEMTRQFMHLPVRSIPAHLGAQPVSHLKSPYEFAPYSLPSSLPWWHHHGKMLPTLPNITKPQMLDNKFNCNFY